MRGLKFGEFYTALIGSESHPTRMRGLKLHMTFEINGNYVSHPTRMRGLKFHPECALLIVIRRILRGCVD